METIKFDFLDDDAHEKQAKLEEIMGTDDGRPDWNNINKLFEQQEQELQDFDDGSADIPDSYLEKQVDDYKAVAGPLSSTLPKEQRDLFYKFDLRVGKIMDISPKTGFGRIYHMWVNFGQLKSLERKEIRKLPVILSYNLQNTVA